jgi:DNA-binding transcriptional MerR regulator
MFRIGEFSRLGRVSMRLLRYYDELDLLRPAHTDKTNGYRYYTAAQLPQLNRILVLRDLGLTLEQIARAIQKDVSAQELRAMLLMRRAEIEQQRAEQTLQLKQLESRIAALDVDTESLPDDVVMRPEPERRYLSVRVRHLSFGSAVETVLALHRELPSQVGRNVLGAFLGVSHSPEFEPDDIDLELGFALEREPARLPVFNGQQLTLQTLPAHAQVATCVRVGSPVHAHLTTGRIARYLEATGYRLAGPSRELFLRPLHDGQIDHAVVEMAFPVEPLG